MPWAYIDLLGAKREVNGPEDLEKLYRLRQVTDDTFVWHETLEDWTRYGMLLGKECPQEDLAEPFALKIQVADEQLLDVSDPNIVVKMLATGTITGAHLAWKEGLANWQPISELHPELVGRAFEIL